MKPGPKPKPTAIRKFEGNPGGRLFNEHEPKPEKCESLEHADWMTDNCGYMQLEKFPLHEVTKLIWDKFAPELVRLGVLTEIDRDKFARYCETFARWLKMKAFLDHHGETYPVYVTVWEPKELSSKEYVPIKRLKGMHAFPQASLYKSLAESLRRYEEEFGIGAASRTRIQTIVQNPFEDQDKPNPFDCAAQRGLKIIR